MERWINKKLNAESLIKLYICFQAFQVQSGFMPKSSFSQIKTQPSREKLYIALALVTVRLRKQLMSSPYQLHGDERSLVRMSL